MRTLRRLLFHNWGWKLGSLALSVLLWYAVVGEPELVTVQAAGVYFANLREGLVIASAAPDRVQIELRGPSAVLSRENLSGVKVFLDLSSVSAPGQQSYTISSRDVALPAGISFLSAVPSRIFLKFDWRRSKDVPVHVDLRGIPAQGFRLARYAVDPETVRVSGAESRLRLLEAAQTDPLEITGLDRSTTAVTNAFVADPAVQLESPPRVTVHLTIERVP